MRRDGINGRDGENRENRENREITHQAKRYPSPPSSFSVTHQALPTLPTPVMLSEAKHLSVGANVERPC